MKTFTIRENIGLARYLVRFHDGVKTHKDGSPFSDITVFNRKRDLQRFVRELQACGYVET